MSPLTREEMRDLGAKYLFPAYIRYFNGEVQLSRAEMQYVFDRDGKKFLDMFGSVVTISVGHCHPEVVDAHCAQARHADHFTTLYPEENLVLAAQALAQCAPTGLTRSFFTNSGSESNDLAAHIATRATKRTGLLALRHSFHGRTGAASSITFQKPWRNVPPYRPDVQSAPNPYIYRKPDGMSTDAFLRWCLRETQEVIDHAFGDNLAAMWVEPLQGNGGVIFGEDWYYDELGRLVHKAGGLLISDEVQTGVGRTGRMWGCSHWTERPDIMVCAKGIGNGHPTGAVITTDKVAEAFGSLTHFNTYGGNPVSMAVVRKVLEIVNRIEVQQNIAARSNQLFVGLRDLWEAHRLIGDVRGRGLMLGIELVSDRDKKTPGDKEALRVMEECMKRGVLLGKGGVYGSVLRVKPPYCITSEDCGKFLNVLHEALVVVESGS